MCHWQENTAIVSGVSQKIKNPNEKGSGFVVGLIALLAVVAVVIGGVIYIGRSQPIEGLPDEDVDFSVALDGDVIRLSKDGAEGAKTATIFEDYSCHYCAQMSEEGHDDELKALNDGKLVAEYRTLNFLDGQEKEQRDGHSTRVFAVARKIAETGDARAYWNFRTMMMADQQNSVTWSDDELADRLEQLGVADEVVSEVRSGIDTTEAKASANANFDDLEKRLGKVSSPHVFVDGKDILENISGDGGLGQWVKVALR